MYFESHRDKSVFFNTGDNVCGAHFHRAVEFLYVIEGEKTARLNGKEYLLVPRQMIVCPPYAVHIFPPCPKSVQFVAAIPADSCKRFEEFCETHSAESPAINDDNGKIFRLISELQTADSKVLFEGITGHILGLYMQKAAFIPVSRTTDKSAVQSIAEYIDLHYAEPITLQTLAAKFGYSPNYFSALFKKYFMTGIPQYVNSVRVQKSLKLLKTQKISAVYFSVGFQSPQQYFLAFRKFFGCTPYEYIHGKNFR